MADRSECVMPRECAEILSELRSLTKATHTELERVSAMLDGPDGIVVRLDRVEQWRAFIQKNVGAIWTGLVGLGGTIAATLINGGCAAQ